MENELENLDYLLDQFHEYLQVNGLGKTHHDNIKKFLTFLQIHDIKVVGIDYNSFSKYILELKESNYNEGYINNLIKAVKRFYKFLIDSKKVDESLLDTLNKFKLLKVPEKRKNYISEEDFVTLVGNTMTFIPWMNEMKIQAVLYFMYYTGVRVKELVNLRRQDIDLKEGIAFINLPTKNAAEKTVFFPIETKITKKGKPIPVRDIIATYFLTEDERTNAFNLSKRKIEHLFSKMNEFLPMGQNLTPHTLRHSFGFLLASKEFREKYAQNYLGHKSPVSTQLYYHVNIDLLKKAYRKKIG